MKELSWSRLISERFLAGFIRSRYLKKRRAQSRRVCYQAQYIFLRSNPEQSVGEDTGWFHRAGGVRRCATVNNGIKEGEVRGRDWDREGGSKDSGGEYEVMGVCRETKLICSQSISFLSVKSALLSLSAPSSIYLSISSIHVSSTFRLWVATSLNLFKMHVHWKNFAPTLELHCGLEVWHFSLLQWDSLGFLFPLLRLYNRMPSTDILCWQTHYALNNPGIMPLTE